MWSYVTMYILNQVEYFENIYINNIGARSAEATESVKNILDDVLFATCIYQRDLERNDNKGSDNTRICNRFDVESDREL